MNVHTYMRHTDADTDADGDTDADIRTQTQTQTQTQTHMQTDRPTHIHAHTFTLCRTRTHTFSLSLSLTRTHGGGRLNLFMSDICAYIPEDCARCVGAVARRSAVMICNTGHNHVCFSTDHFCCRMSICVTGSRGKSPLLALRSWRPHHGTISLPLNISPPCYPWPRAARSPLTSSLELTSASLTDCPSPRAARP